MRLDEDVAKDMSRVLGTLELDQRGIGRRRNVERRNARGVDGVAALDGRAAVHRLAGPDGAAVIGDNGLSVVLCHSD